MINDYYTSGLALEFSGKDEVYKKLHLFWIIISAMLQMF